jgi:homoserine dehydrogenase
MFEENLGFNEALTLAQQLGFAESDPKLDVEGFDALNKWTFLLTHAYGVIESPENILFNGIQNIKAGDALTASNRNQQIKLVAQARKSANGKVAAFVLPQFVNEDDHLSLVKNEYNGVVIESSFADKQFFYGKGAGSLPTASAVLSDIAALRYQYKYEYKKLYHRQGHELTDDVLLKVYTSFDNIEQVPLDKFASITEWHIQKERKYLTGIISLKELKKDDWWKKNNISLIVDTDPIAEGTAIAKKENKKPELVPCDWN